MSESSVNEVCLVGIGVVAPFAIGWAPVYEAAGSGAVQFEPWDAALEPPYPDAKLGLVKRFPKERYFTERQMRLMDRAMMISSTATGLALEDAGLGEVVGDGSRGEDTATIFASTRGELPSLYRFGSPLFEGSTSYNPAMFPMIARNITCGQAALRFNLKGWSSMTACGEISGLHALHRGTELVRLGRAQRAVVCAYEVLSKLSLHQSVARWRKYGVEPRCGVGNAHVPVEGACVLVLENKADVLARGAKPYATLGHISHGYLQGDLQQASERAVQRHLRRQSYAKGCDVLGTGGRQGSSEALALEAALTQSLREHLRPVREVQTRSLFGDALSQSALLQLACIAQGLKDQGLAQGVLVSTDAAESERRSGAGPLISALVSQVTDRRAFGLASLTRFEAASAGA